jgi:predicted RND superfamily exporter protein
VVITALLIIPSLVMERPGQASQDPSGEVFDLQRRIDDTFPSPTHNVPFIVEARDGDMLTRAALSELLLNETRLRAQDLDGALAPDSLPSQPYLSTFFDNDTGRTATGVLTVADAVEGYLRATTGGQLSLFEATDEQVKLAVYRVLSNPATSGLRESFSVKATSERRAVNGEEIDWWTSPALVLNVQAGNAALGGGVQSIGVSSDDTTLDKEEFNRNVQEALRGDQESYRLWGIAIDVNLESADEGAASGVFITFTAIAAIAVVGIALRSYWAVALTGAGLGALMIWLKGISLLVGIKGGLVIDLIVPIAMISLGVDFAVHAVRRFQEEKALGLPSRRAIVTGLGGVLPALTLAMTSDGIAFLSNASAGIEAVVHFGIAAGIAVGSAFLVLGIALPLTYARIDALQERRRATKSRSSLAMTVLASAGAATGAGAAVILLVAVSPAAGAAALAVTFAVFILAPATVLWLSTKNRIAIAPGQSTATLSAQSATGSHRIDALETLTRYKFFVLGGATLITALALVAALRLEATFDVKDFFAQDSDFVVSLDKLDEHVADRSGEPATVLVEGNLSNIGALSAIQAVFDNFQANDHVGRDSNGVVNIYEPNILQIVRDVVASEKAQREILATQGVDISGYSPYGFPDSNDETAAVLTYAVQSGVPSQSGELAYTPDEVRSVLRHNTLGSTLDVTRFTVFLPGTREQSVVAIAKSSIDRDLESLGDMASITDYGLTGSPFMRQAQLEATTTSLQRSIPIAAAASFLLLLIAFRSFRFAVVTIIPIGLVVAWLYAIMEVSGFALNFVTATIGAVSIGVGIDYSIHLTERFREELRKPGDRSVAMRDALRGTGVALAGSAGSSVAGFAIMGFAPMPLFSTYGFLTAIMIVLALAAALLVLPSLLLLATSGFPRRATARKASAK